MNDLTLDELIDLRICLNSAMITIRVVERVRGRLQTLEQEELCRYQKLEVKVLNAISISKGSDDKTHVINERI